MRKRYQLRTQSRSIDKPLLLVVLGLVLFGLVMIWDASVVEAQESFGDKFFYLRQQLVWAGVGVASLFFFARFPNPLLKRFATPLLLVNILLLILVLLPQVGLAALGARRWLGFGPIVFQPAELAKLSLSLYLAKIFAEGRRWWYFLLPTVVILGLVLAEPDLGTSLVLAGLSFIALFVSGAPVAYFVTLFGLGTFTATLAILSSDYRRRRLLAFLDPLTDPLGRSYHIRQILIALGSGGLFGVGLGQSRQKFLFLPATTTDSIFAVIAEEFGFLGAGAVVLAFIFIAWRGFSIARLLQDDFAKILATIITGWISLQAFINLGAMVALVPLTGIPLPFLSYGGSSLVITLASVGILLNISRERKTG